jgi:SAM-dependent methyltransferase
MGVFERASRSFRAERMRQFAKDFGVTDRTRILDIGGTPYNWELCPVRPRLTILNTPRATEPVPEGVDWVAADGCKLPFGDAAFDIVFSNSVIEHLGTTERQREFASEVMRVGRRFCVQTPNRWFPVETHLLTPLVHYLPKRLQAPLVRRWTVWQALTGIRGERREFYIEHYLADVLLLDAGALMALFPGAEIRRERFLGATKSLLAVRLLARMKADAAS